MHRILANGITDATIVLERDDRLDDNNSNLHVEPACRALNNKRPSNNAFNLENPPILPNRTTNEDDDSDIGINNTKSPRLTKRQRSASPPYNSIPSHAGTSPLSYSEDWNGGQENIHNGDRIESEYDDMYSVSNEYYLRRSE